MQSRHKQTKHNMTRSLAGAARWSMSSLRPISIRLIAGAHRVMHLIDGRVQSISGDSDKQCGLTAVELLAQGVCGCHHQSEIAVSIQHQGVNRKPPGLGGNKHAIGQGEFLTPGLRRAAGGWRAAQLPSNFRVTCIESAISLHKTTARHV